MHPERRSSEEQSEIVELAIFVAEYSSIRGAAFCLSMHGIDISVARRVLLKPSMRRAVNHGANHHG